MNTIRKSVYLKATLLEVWAYLTEPDKLAIWFHKPKTPLRAGNEYALFGVESGKRVIWGAVIEACPPDYLEYSFTVEPLNGVMTRVQWWIEAVEVGTLLRLEHSGLPEGSEAYGVTLAMDEGWEEHMGRMRVDLHAVPA